MAGEHILCLDVTCQPAHALIVEIEDSRLRLIEKAAIVLNPSSLPENLLKQELSNEGAVYQPPSNTVSQELQNTSDTAPGEQAPVPETNGNSPTVTPLNQMLTSTWSSTILLVPPLEHLSLNLDLPFGDAKNISKILDLEIQDRVAIDTSDFLIEHSTIGPTKGGEYDVHVNLVPKTYLKNLLTLCHNLKVEPVVITTPGGILDALAYLANTRLPRDCALLFETDSYVYLVARIAGIARSDRVIIKDRSSQLDKLATEVRVTLSALQARYQCNFEKIYILEGAHQQAWEEKVDIPIERIKAGEFVSLSNGSQNDLSGSHLDGSHFDSSPFDSSHCAAALVTVFAQEEDAPKPLTNFRTKEFAYSPKMKELLRASRVLLPYVSAVVGMVIIFTLVRYILGHHRISTLEAAMHARIHQAMPTLRLEEGKEVSQVNAEKFRVEQDLTELGTPSKHSPLEILLQVSNDFPTAPNINFSVLNIRGNKITIEGSAPDYTAVERIQKAFEKRKSFYCRVERNRSPSYSAGTGSRSFAFEMFLCE